MEKIKEQELEIARKFFNYEIVDSFEVLGFHKLKHRNILRAYLPQNSDWKVFNKNGAVQTELIIALDGFYSWIIADSAVADDYYFKCNQGTDTKIIQDPYSYPQLLNDETKYLWNSGKLKFAWNDLGANQIELHGIAGFLFRVWAPSARRVSIVSDFNHWNPLSHGMRSIKDSGLWEIFIPLLDEDSYLRYKYHITTQAGEQIYKFDPYAKQMEHPPNTASIVYSKSKIEWTDQSWMAKRTKLEHQKQPISIYEVHLPSWKKAEYGRELSYLELAEKLVPYVRELGFSHVEFMPVSEYPLAASWGYQPVGLFAPTIRLGTARELKILINCFHEAGIGVLLDWVPGHFPVDSYGLSQYDGSYLYEYQDERKGFHPDWQTLIYNYDRTEVQTYLKSNANYWIKEFHADGLRFDAVSSMLYLSYSRKEGEWEPNIHGGAENLGAVEFIRSLNEQLHQDFPGVLTFAEEATMWQGVSRSVANGGLGFDFKWNMGWMHDSLVYIQSEPGEKVARHHVLTHCIDYSFSESYLLPLSHDEVVHGKSPMIGKMPGYDEQKFPLLRCYYSYMWAHPGKKLIFMGNELAMRKEWDFASELQWDLLQYPAHQGMTETIKALNSIYHTHSELSELDSNEEGFRWIKKDDQNESTFAFTRINSSGKFILAIFNFSANPRLKLRVGVPTKGAYQVIYNSNWEIFSGSLAAEKAKIMASDRSWDSQFHSLEIDLGAFEAIFLEAENKI